MSDSEEFCGSAPEAANNRHGSLRFQAPEVGLMNQVGGLERVTGAPRAQIISGQASKLTVDQGRQFIERRFVAVAPLDEQLSYGCRGGHQFLY